MKVGLANYTSVVDSFLCKVITKLHWAISSFLMKQFTSHIIVGFLAVIVNCCQILNKMALMLRWHISVTRLLRLCDRIHRCISLHQFADTRRSYIGMIAVISASFERTVLMTDLSNSRSVLRWLGDYNDAFNTGRRRSPTHVCHFTNMHFPACCWSGEITHY